MKKTYIIFAILLLACGCSKEEKKESIPSASLSDFVDPLFFGYMQTQYDTNDDFIFQSEEIAAVTDLDLSKQTYIFNLKGLEKFVELRSLDISGLSLQDKNLKITNPKLMQFVCSNMDLRELNIESLTELEILDCSKNTYMNTLDLSHNKKLRELNCDGVSGGSFEDLDLSNNNDIEKISCQSNNMNTIDLTNCNKLKHLACNLAGIKSINLSDCVDLEYLDLSSNDLLSIDVGKCNLLKYLNVRYNGLTSLGISNNTYLEEITFSVVSFTSTINSLDIVKNLNLKTITIDAVSESKSPLIIYTKQDRTKPQIISLSTEVSYEFQYK